MSVLGLTALLVSSQLTFDAIRLAGAAYLIYLGARLLLTRAFDAVGTDRAAGKPNGVAHHRALAEGFLSDLSNSRTVLVHASVVPQFMTASSTGADAFVPGAVFAVLGFLSLVACALVLGAAGTLLSSRRLMRNVLRVSGGNLAIFGLGPVLERPSH